MASSLRIPAPPRTPTPPSPILEDGDTALGIDGLPRPTHSAVSYEPDTLAPLADPFAGNARLNAMNATLNAAGPYTSPLLIDGSLGPPSAAARNPFNFQTQTIADSPVVAKSVGQAHSCIPFICVQSSADLPVQTADENIRNMQQASSSTRWTRGARGMNVCVSPLPSEQAGNHFRPAFARPSSPTPSGLGSPAADGKSTLRGRRQVFANLTPPTVDHPYTFPSINNNTQNIGQRRGHRYKHSSVSTQHQIFLEPPPRAPLALPASLPIPTLKELWASMSREQTTRFGWCFCHNTVAGIVLYSSGSSLALTALSHLIFFDAISATICVAVDIFHNFEVWKRSSIRHPFGLERAEVLAGFAMSVFLLFMGFDLVSHNLKHVLESLGSHQPHHPHSHHRVAPGSIDFAALSSIIATLISAYGLKNHARIGKVMRFAVLESLPSVLSNPSHLLTLSCSALLLVLPLLTITMYHWLDRLVTAVIAISMFTLGVRLAIAQGNMLLMSYSGAGVSDVMREISAEPAIASVDEARFWQVHYGLCMANLKLRLGSKLNNPSDEQALAKLRERICVLVKNRLGGGYGKGLGLKWEVTVQFSVDGKH